VIVLNKEETLVQPVLFKYSLFALDDFFPTA